MVTYHLCLELTKLGHEVLVFTSSLGEIETIQEYGNVTVHRYATSLRLENTYISPGLLFNPLLVDCEADVVHIQMGTPPGAIAGYLYAKKRKKPYVLSFHGESEAVFGGVSKRLLMSIYNRFIIDRILRDARQISTLSEYFFDQSRYLRRYTDKIWYIPNGVDASDYVVSFSKDECRKRLQLPADKKIVLFVGGLTHSKAPDVLLRAMKIAV